MKKLLVFAAALFCLNATSAFAEFGEPEAAVQQEQSAWDGAKAERASAPVAAVEKALQGSSASTAAAVSRRASGAVPAPAASCGAKPVKGRLRRAAALGLAGLFLMAWLSGCGVSPNHRAEMCARVADDLSYTQVAAKNSEDANTTVGGFVTQLQGGQGFKDPSDAYETIGFASNGAINLLKIGRVMLEDATDNSMFRIGGFNGGKDIVVNYPWDNSAAAQCGPQAQKAVAEAKKALADAAIGDEYAFESRQYMYPYAYGGQMDAQTLAAAQQNIAAGHKYAQQAIAEANKAEQMMNGLPGVKPPTNATSA